MCTHSSLLLQEWFPQGESVLDSNGEAVEGVEVWGEDSGACGIKVLTANQKVRETT